MNHIYKVVWNRARQCYMVVSEYAKSQTKSCSTAKLFAAKAALAAVATVMSVGIASQADAEADPNVRLATATDYVAASVATKPDDTYQSTKKTVDGISYWVKEGWSIESAVKKRFPNAKNSNLVVLYKNSSDAQNATFACVDTTVLGTSVNTVLNKNILTVEDNGYVGAVNTTTTGATYSCDYWIEKNGVWTNVGGSETKISQNAYQATLENGVWKANGKVVDYHDIYAIGDKAWVFKNPDGSLYKGSVFGLNNELLKTMKGTDDKLVSVWGTDRIDADGELANLTVGQVNRITDTFTKNDKALAEADIKQVNSADRGANDAANVVKKYTLIRNDENGTAVTGTIVDTDTQYTFNRTGGTGGQDVTVTVTDNAGSNPQPMVTGSIVTADSTSKVTKITINGVDYSVVDTITTATKSEDGKTLTISKTGAADVVFTDTDTTYTAGDNVQISGTTISATDTITTATKSEDGKTLTISKTGAADVVFTDTNDVTNLESVAGAVNASDTKKADISVTTTENGSEVTKTGTIDLSTLTTNQGDTNATNIANNATNIANNATNIANNTSNINRIDNYITTNEADWLEDTKYSMTQMSQGTGIVLNTVDAQGAPTAQNSIGFSSTNKYLTIENGQNGIEWTVNIDDIKADVTQDTNTKYQVGAVAAADGANGATINLSKKDLGDSAYTVDSSVGMTGDDNITVGVTNGVINVALNDDITVNNITVNEQVTIGEGDTITTITGGTINTTTIEATTINGDTINGDTINTTEINVGTTQITENNITMGDTVITNESITVGDTVIEGDNITTNTVNTTTVNTTEINLGDTNITEADYLEVVEESKKHTTVVLAQGEENLQISQDTNENGGIEYTLSLNGDITVDNITVNESITMGDTIINEEGITTNNIDATTINTETINLGDTQITENNITMGDTVITNENITVGDTVIEGDNITTNTVNTTTVNTTEINLGDTNITEEDYLEVVEESKKHTTVKLGEGEENLELSAGTNANGGLEYTLSLKGDITVDNITVNEQITVGDTIINGDSITTTTINGDTINAETINLGDTVITENNITMGDTVITNENITVGDTVIEGDSITTETVNTTTVNTTEINLGDTNITEESYNELVEEAHKHTTVVAGDNVVVKDLAKEGEAHKYEVSLKDVISVTEVNATTINGDTINTETINLGDTVITEEQITMGDTIINGDSITTTTVNTENIQLGDTLITEETYNQVVEEAGKHTTVVAGDNVVVKDLAKEGEAHKYEVSLKGDIEVNSVTMGDTVITENNITMGDTVITNENITVGDTIIEGDSITTNTVNTENIQLGDTLITEETYNELVEEAQKHTTVVAGDNIIVEEGTNDNGGKEYTVSLKGDIEVNSVTMGDTVITENNISMGDTVITNENITVGDTVINGDSITTSTINGDTINATTVNTEEIKMGDTVITENKIEMGDTKITNESITVGDTVITGDNITINGDSVVTDVTVGDVVKVDEYTNKQTITVTEADGTVTTKDIIDRDTTYTADEKFITITEGNEIQLITHVDDVAAGWDTEDKHNIIIQLKGTSNGVAASSIGTEQVIEGIALSEEVGDVTNEEYVSNFGAGTTLVEAVNTTYTEAKKHTTVVLGEGEENLKLEEGENADGGIEYTVSLNKDIKADSITINDSKVVINKEGINAGDNKITNVADGEVSATSKDAVNGSQLYGLAQNVNKLGGRVSKGLAGASALAALHPLEFDPDDKLSFAAGVGHYGGKTAAAIGAFYRPDEKVMISLGGTMGDGKEMVNAGVSFSLDRTPNKTNTKTAMAKEIVELRERLAQMEQFMMQQQGFKPLSGEMKLFPDVPENHWAYEYVAKLYADGIIEGYPDGNYSGDRMMTRYEMAAIIYRAMQRGANVDGKMLKEFEPELCRVRVDRISGADNDYNKIERVRLNTGVGKDKYANKIQVAEAAK